MKKNVVKPYRFNLKLYIKEYSFSKMKYNFYWLKTDKSYSYTNVDGIINLNISFSNLSLYKLLNKYSLEIGA